MSVADEGVQHSVHRHAGFTEFRPTGSARAHVLMVPFATDPELIATVLELGENQHHAWGVKELLADDVAVTVLDPPAPGRLSRLRHDARLGDIHDVDMVYCNHNVLVRSALGSVIRRSTPPMVSLVYAGERLLAARRHHGILAMTPTAHRRFASLGGGGVDVAFAPWGIDPSSRLHEPFTSSDPVTDMFVSSGVTGRDFATLFAAARAADAPVSMFARGQSVDGAAPSVSIADSNVSPWEIRAVNQRSLAALVILDRDDANRNAVGWTNMLELMCMGMAVIKTRTGPLDEIVDIEQIDAGVLVPPNDPDALAAAMTDLRSDPARCRAMGRRGAAYVREHLSMDRFASHLLRMVDSAIGS